MMDKAQDAPAEILFSEGKKYNWRQDRSPAAATLARASFQQAASMGHTGAIRALAHMTFDGRGGAQDREHALLLLWSAFLRRDHDALQELVDMLESYAETVKGTPTGNAALQAAGHVEELNSRLNRVSNFMLALTRERSQSSVEK
jgi:TPR repeat protein